MIRRLALALLPAIALAACSGMTKTSEPSPPETTSDPFVDHPELAANPIEGNWVLLRYHDIAAARDRCGDRPLPEWMLFGDTVTVLHVGDPNNYVDVGTYTYQSDDEDSTLGAAVISRANDEVTILFMKFERPDLGTFSYTTTVQGPEIDVRLCEFLGTFQIWEGPPYATDTWPLIEAQERDSVEGLATPEGRTGAVIIFIENETDQALEVLWINTQGRLEYSFTVSARRSDLLYTYAGHLWAVRDQFGQYAVFAAPAAGNWRVRITE